MGLLDSLVGSAVSSALGGGNNQQQGNGGNAALITALLPVVMGMISNNGGQQGQAAQAGGGLGNLVSQFTQAGLGNAIQSWIGTGQNQPVSGDQITSALGSDFISQVASKLGTDNQQAASGLAQVLPTIIDKLTPNGQAPANGLGSTDDIMGALGGLLGGGGQQQGGGLGDVLSGLAGMLKK